MGTPSPKVMGENFTEFPLVRFKTQGAAEGALEALKAGQATHAAFVTKQVQIPSRLPDLA